MLEPTSKRRKTSNIPGDGGEGVVWTARPPRTTSANPEVARSRPSPGRILAAEHVSPPRQQVPNSIETQQFGANRSTISLAMNMYESLGTHAPTQRSVIPGDDSPSSSSGPTWSLQTLRMPSLSAMDALIDLYFAKMDWFIWVFHKPSFTSQAQDILSAKVWRREDMSKVLVTLTVAALGLKSALQNTSPQGQQFLASVSPDPQGLMNQMIGEVRMHLLDLLDDSHIETIQVCVLLGAFYIFHGSPSLAWAMIGMSVRAAYAMGLHCELEGDDQVATQVRRRCWNHVTVADTFASQIYSRPASLDPAFSDLLPLTNMDDTTIELCSNEQETQYGVCSGPVTALTFHWLKAKLYVIIRKTISTFRLLRLHSPMTAQDLQSLVDAVKRIDGQLAEWRRTLPPPLNSGNLLDDDNTQQLSFQELFRNHEGEASDPQVRRIKLQACLLQVTYDAAVILAHRPLLEHRLSAEYREGIPKSSVDVVSRSFDVSIKAALRISRIPVMQFEHEFCLAFIFVHLFTAGVILCIPPTSHPHTSLAQDAKAGVFRIIEAAKELSPRSQIARHTETLLSDLLKLSLHREVDMAFKDNHKSNPVPWPSRSEEQTVRYTNTTCNVGTTLVENHESAAGRKFNERNYDESLLPVSPTSVVEESAASCGHGSNSQLRPSHSDHQESNLPNFGDEHVDLYPVSNTVGADIQPLDLPLDEAFGAFGQGMHLSSPSLCFN